MVYVLTGRLPMPLVFNLKVFFKHIDTYITLNVDIFQESSTIAVIFGRFSAFSKIQYKIHELNFAPWVNDWRVRPYL